MIAWMKDSAAHPTEVRYMCPITNSIGQCAVVGHLVCVDSVSLWCSIKEDALVWNRMLATALEGWIHSA
jgi:hypothetical protein